MNDGAELLMAVLTAGSVEVDLFDMDGDVRATAEATADGIEPGDPPALVVDFGQADGAYRIESFQWETEEESGVVVLGTPKPVAGGNTVSLAVPIEINWRDGER